MSDDGRDVLGEQPPAAETSPIEEASPASPPPILDIAPSEPSAGVKKTVGKARGKPKAKGKAMTSAAMMRVEDVLDRDTLNEQIKALKTDQAKVKAERAKLAKHLKNTERRKTRLHKRARLLTDEDLLQVLMLRKTLRTAQQGCEPAAALGSPASSGLTDAERT